ncbi:MAG: N-acetyl-alpha-D-glucosaminyl L-malate synthase BshA [Candidatus Latescibacterota bacterium]|nr:MAG: N-acetyl-alpha-D-glucosaminyl L-malate synthase BshA [Candidatus Latescibacterota bacterium]
MKRASIGIVCYPTPGGSGVIATELGKSLARIGHQVHFITHGLPSRLDSFNENLFFHKVEPGDYPVFQQFTPYSLSLAVKIREVAMQCDLDIVHSHYAIPYATSAFLAKEMLKTSGRDLKSITTLHGTDITLVGLMPSFHEITRFSIAVSDAITAVSRFLERQTVEAFKIDKPIRVIHNFVDCNEFRPARDTSVRQRYASGDEKLLIHVSNFRKVKNIPVVIDVFSRLRASLPCRLLLVGDGPELEPTERLVHDQGLAGDVVFLGDQEFIADILPAGDVFLLPSEHESFGLAALEAMSCGLPVVASNIGGLHEVIDDGETGFLFDPHDVNGMSEVTLRLFTDETWRKTVGLKSRERAKRDFGKDKIIGEYIALYEELV